MVQGVKWKATTSEIIAAIKKAKGRVSHVAKAFDISHMTIRARMAEEPLIKEALDEARNSFDTTMLDAAENTLMVAISKQETDLNSALKSSFFILNNKGEERGYSPKNNPKNQQSSGMTLEDFNKYREYIEAEKDNGRVSGTEESNESDVENKPSILN